MLEKMKTKILFLMLAFLVLTSSAYANSITISSVTSRPSEIQPGNRVDISVRLENQGDVDIKDISVSLDLDDDNLPFIPVGSAAKKVIKKIDEDESGTVEFTLMSSPDAKPDTYKIPIIVSYKDNDDSIEEKSVIGLVVESLPVLSIAVEESDIFRVGQIGEVTVRFVNKGLGDVKFLTAELSKSSNYDILSANTVYIGNVGPDDFETASFKMRFNNRIGQIPLNVEYRDNKNKLFEQTFNLEFPLYSEKEAIELGLENKSQTGMYIGIAVVIILFFLYRRYRKRKRAR